MSQYTERLYNGIIKENPSMVMILGMCPTLATTTTVINGVGMGLSTTVVLVLCNIVISLLRKVIPDEVRIPAFIVVIASFVTVVDFLMQGYFPALSQSLGVYIPLIVVNCIILGRAEAFASKNGVLVSAFDGIGMGIGFTLALTVVGLLRELIGAGTAFGFQVIPKSVEPIGIFIKAPGAFLVLAIVIAVLNALHIENRSNELVNGSCDGCCAKGAKSKANCKEEGAK